MKKLVAVVVAILAAGVATVPAVATGASENHATYVWVVGATTATDTAMAPDGSTITMNGDGMLMAGPNSMATGGGTFTKSNGDSGTWTANAIDSFVSYGSGAAQGLPASFTGGEAKLRVTLSNGQKGTLTIVCVLGSPPPSKMEGIQLILGAGVSDEYTDQDGGNTIFIKS